ncbi:MAG: HAD-IIIA family hydrolase [Coprobacillus sp.]|nr:HAD-IIIA family hydrolase [Coprobacillus sp.]
MKKITLFFDLDGTLLNTLDDLKEATNFALEKLGYPIRTLAEIQSFVGNGVAKLIARSIPNNEDNPDYEECLRLFTEYYNEHYDIYTKPYDGILDLLKKLKAEDKYTLVVVSNKLVNITKILVSEMFPGIFDYVEGDREGQNKKPHPDMINHVVSKSEIDLANSLVIGDSAVDLEMGNNVGAKTILVSWGFRERKDLENLGAIAIVDNTSELYSAISNWSDSL